MRFLIEQVDQSEIRLVNESKEDGSKDLFIEGIFAQAEKKNRNGRIYPKNIMESATNAYIKDYVATRRAIGELTHPTNRPMPSPEMASHLITELKMDGNNVLGKAKILSTPQGNIVRGLLDGGVQLGVSTRGLGSLVNRAGTSYVDDDYKITAVDIVTDPSAIDAWVNAVNESQEWLITGDGQVVEQIQKTIKKKKLTEQQKWKMFKHFFESLRG